MKPIRVALLAVIIFAWVIAAGSFVNSIADVSSFPGGVRSVLGLWPDADTVAGTAVRFGAVAVLIAGIVGYRALGKRVKRRQALPADADAR
ncbi:hypothetical protein [Homoserinimonas hongtaonis]|uniref:Uncharacterized protein n=1 Tax=Homoserinimonas hongtaonis TaxID=2079791 RepID=A0A2U1SYV0_9MICO|nr:hypothetical protein [Salinibacterium hongtaonis]AWB89355.1 hypothetical protein C2138_07220 [Salinibacterium hongtaonis]PWB96804.1 hypothetical protein DF220_02370 [Salinibacterium hongtaonis]